MPLLGMGGETEKGIALPVLPWWNAVAINDVGAKRFYGSANGRLLNGWFATRVEADKVALLLKVWRQRQLPQYAALAEGKIALSGGRMLRQAAIYQRRHGGRYRNRTGAALDQPLTRILEQIATGAGQRAGKPDVIYLTGGSAVRH